MRSIWSGSLSFGLINIPVKIYSASEERTLKFRLLEKGTFCPINYAKICRKTNKEVKYQDIVKGYEYREGEYVILTDEDFHKALPRKTKTIDIISFVKEDEIPRELAEKPYFIEPDERSQKAYVLLREAMKNSEKVAVGRWVLRNKENIAMIKPQGNALLMIQLRHLDELRKPEGLKFPEKAEYAKKEADLALMLIEQLESDFDITDYKDTYTEELQKIIEQKAKGEPVRISEEAPAPSDMRNLMEILKESLEKEKKARSGEKVR